MKTGNQAARDTGQRGLELVVSELQKRGAVVQVVSGQANLLTARSSNKNHEIQIRTKTKGPSSRVWQVSTTEGRKPGEVVDTNEYWVLVDLPDIGHPQFYIMSGTWFRRDLYEDHLEYLESHGGERPVSPASTHHSVHLDRIEQFENRWDLLGL